MFAVENTGLTELTALTILGRRPRSVEDPISCRDLYSFQLSLTTNDSNSTKRIDCRYVLAGACRCSLR